jgi:predicted secreted Zn-dependent protease
MSYLPRSLIFFFLLCEVFPILSARGQDQLTIRTNYYYATGASPRQIRESMAKARPARLLHDAQTDWHIDWKFTSVGGSANCAIETLTLRTAITITLPRWVAPTNAPPELTAKWKDYMAALEKHEIRHRMMAEQAANRMRAELPRLHGPCGTFQNTVNASANQILADCKRREADYDLKTEHGLSEGARFP